jgi:dTDP-4-dehydrorhamnose reductase
MNPTILLIGKSGQVGGELSRLLPEIGELVAPDRRDIDLGKPESIRRVVREVRPQIIVNAAAYTAVDVAEAEQKTAYAVNAEAPGLLAQEAKLLGALLVHYSTDYVFDGLKRAPYVETDPTNPLNAYGKSKLAGEQAIRDSGAFHLVFRTSWVYSTRGKNFLLTILRLATEWDELRIVCDQVGAPTRALDIAAATTKVLKGIFRRTSSGAQETLSLVSGTYHMTAAGQTSWFDFAQTIFEQARAAPQSPPWLAAITGGSGLKVKRVIPIRSEEFPSPARRPQYSVLSNERFAKTFRFALSDWRDQLRECFSPQQ